MALADTAQLAVRLTLDDRQFRGPLSRVQKQLGGLNTSFGRVGRGVGQLGTGLARAGTVLGALAVGGIALATREALKFEDAFAGVRKTVSEAELTAAGTSFEELRNTFLQFSSEIPIAATEFARLGEIAGALGVRAQDIDDFAKTTALLGVTTNLSADEAADALGRIGTILSFTGQDFQAFADILVNLGNQGASTEAEIIEITKRFAGVGKQAGLSVEEITALSSAVSSLGAQPEAAGSALSRIFANLTTEIANGTAKGKAFAKVTGDSLETLRKRIDKGDALGIFLETLEEISGLSRTEQASVLKALGITNVRDRDAIVKMAGNLDEVNRQLQVAQDSTGALAAEASKRFASPLQKLVTLRGAAVRLAIAFGDGIAPAIGRAADKLAGFFRDEDNLNQATQLGQQIGAAIDGIDWAGVIAGAKQFGGVLKGALDFALLILKALNALPTEIKAAGAGFLALNKLSGGLIGAGAGNIIGGLGEAATRGLAARAPGIGKLFAQPVFVTNWPIGGLGGPGVAGTTAKSSTTANAVKALIPVAVAAAALEVGTNIVGLNDPRHQLAAPVNRFGGTTFRGTNVASEQLVNLQKAELALAQRAAQGDTFAATQLAGVRTAIANLQTGLPTALAQPFNDVAFRLGERVDLASQKDALANTQLRARIEAARIATQTGTQKITAVQQATRTAVSQAKIAQIQAGRSDASRIVAAVRASRPIVNVSVTASTYTTNTTVRSGGTVKRSTGQSVRRDLPVSD